jgi:hypothetical protein
MHLNSHKNKRISNRDDDSLTDKRPGHLHIFILKLVRLWKDINCKPFDDIVKVVGHSGVLMRVMMMCILF